MSHVYVLAKNENCSRVLLYSRTANVRAHHFYERCGFAKLGFELGYEIREE
jgi:ribosomal protein S18 acetylase RimI-like enzyme